ncbi:hypothetical protein IE53DRAFT_7210 [Violaceomyces palustris]|uniref:Uncharacterized protein n=1 Tax=Violaceomyces palustris TaxID=1673888 RepID=A0ACD0P2H2_9BASI|nr:hypothetical protein IE53DRAFT_7210 [Violaceomyces palustris]
MSASVMASPSKRRSAMGGALSEASMRTTRSMARLAGGFDNVPLSSESKRSDVASCQPSKHRSHQYHLQHTYHHHHHGLGASDDLPSEESSYHDRKTRREREVSTTALTRTESRRARMGDQGQVALRSEPDQQRTSHCRLSRAVRTSNSTRESGTETVKADLETEPRESRTASREKSTSSNRHAVKEQDVRISSRSSYTRPSMVQDLERDRTVSDLARDSSSTRDSRRDFSSLSRIDARTEGTQIRAAKEVLSTQTLSSSPRKSTRSGSCSPTKQLTMPSPFNLACREKAVEVPANGVGSTNKRSHNALTPSTSEEFAHVRDSSMPTTSGFTRTTSTYTSRPLSKALRGPDPSEARSPENRISSRQGERLRRNVFPVEREEGDRKVMKEEEDQHPSSQTLLASTANNDSQPPGFSPSRKPINLLTLRPSPGKARRGMFKHDSDSEEEQQEQDSDPEKEGGKETLLTRGPLSKAMSPPKRHVNAADKVMHSAATRSSIEKQSSSSSSSSSKTLLSSETADALANLEASLAKLGKPSQRRHQSWVPKKEDPCSPPKRSLPDHKPRAPSPKKEQVFKAMPIVRSQERNSTNPFLSGTINKTRHDEDEGEKNDADAFKVPAIPGPANPLLDSSNARYRHRASRSVRDLPVTLDPATDEAREKPRAAIQAVEVKVERENMGMDSASVKRESDAILASAAEAKRKAELKAARRRSMHSILSFGGGGPSTSSSSSAARREALTSASGTSDPPSSKDSADGTKGDKDSVKANKDSAESEKEARRAAKAARRRSLYTYVPVKREDAQGGEIGDQSTGNVSSGFCIGSTSIHLDPDQHGSSSTAGSKPLVTKRFLKGLTILVDVRDQDGEDANAVWVEMLKSCGAKVLVRPPSASSSSSSSAGGVPVEQQRLLSHIVYKSGKPSTMHAYRAHPEPKPFVVGVSWVVKCLELGNKVDERDYVIEVGKEAIFGHRRRSSMAPRQAPIMASPPRLSRE